MPSRGQQIETIARGCFAGWQSVRRAGEDLLVPPVEQLPDRALEFCRSPQHFLLNLARAEGPIARFRLTDESFAVLSEPATVCSVLNGSQDDYEKGELYQILRGAFGESVFSMDEGWSEMRAVLVPLFSRQRMLALSPIVTELVEQQIERWVQLPAGQPIDLLIASKRLAFDVVSRGLLGVPPGPVSDELFEVLSRMERTESVRSYYLAKRVPGITAAFQGTPLLGAIDRVAYAIAEGRMSNPGSTDDLIGAAMASSYFAELPPAQRLKFVRDLVISMLAAGYISSGEGIFWTFYLLALHPDAQSIVRRDVGAQTRVTAAYQEALRLYPPAWFLGRVARKAVRLGSEEFAAGTRLVCSPFVVHRMSMTWPDPDAFRPARFEPGAAVAPKTYIPFGSGARGCLGRILAGMEATALITATVARFDLELVSSAPISLTAAYSMQPRDRVLFRLVPR
jgi:cytochrome P450